MTTASRRSFGRFTLLEDIRSGTNGRVFKANERLSSGDSRPAALKVFPRISPSDERSAARFREEALALKDFGGKSNIVEVRDFGIDDGLAWIAMEYLPRSLEDIASDDPAEESTVLAMLRDIAQALDFLHSRRPAPVLHRDIKPENILVSDSGVYKIADLELTSAVHSSSTKNHISPKFAAPESARGDAKAECPASDLYSLGMVAYYLLLGRTLFNQQFDFLDPGIADAAPTDPDLHAIRHAQLWMQWHSSPDLVLPEASHVLPAVRPDLSRIIARLTAKNLDERYTSARELLVDLREIDGNVALSDAPSEPASPLNRVLVWSTRCWTPLAITIKLAVLLALAAPLAASMFVPPTPRILLQPGTLFSGQGTLIGVRFDVDNLPPDASVRVGTGDDAPSAVVENHAGHRTTLVAHVPLPEPGRAPASIRILSAQGATLATLPILTERRPRLRVRMATDPPVEAVRVTLTDAEGRSHSLTTDADGSATFFADPGPCDVRADHPRFVLLNSSSRFDVREEPEQRVRLRLAPRFGTLTLVVDPPDADVTLRRDLDAPQTLTLVNGSASLDLEPGVWTLRATAPARQTISREVHLERGKTTPFSLQLPPEAASPPPVPVTPPPMTLDDVARFVRTHAPWRQLALTPVEPPGTLRIRGVVLSQAELDTLTARLAPLADRVTIEARVDAEETRRLVLAALRSAGAMHPAARLIRDDSHLLVELKPSATLDLAKAQQIIGSFILDPARFTLRAALE